MVAILSWIAIVLLSISYWFQIFKIYRRKEANDLSILYHVCLAVGFGMLTYTAYIEDSTIFLAKQIMTTIPVLILIGQIFYFDRYWDFRCGRAACILERTKTGTIENASS